MGTNTTTKQARWLVPLVCLGLLFALNGLVAAQTIHIEYGYWGENDVYGRPITEAFNARQDKIHVEYRPMTGGSFSELMAVQLAAGTAPALFGSTYGSAHYAPVIEWGPRGLMADLMPFVERDAAEINLQDMPEAIQKLGQVNGRWYGFPVLIYTGYAVFYNRDLVNEAGLGDPDADWTVDDFVEYGMKLTADKNGDGTMDQWGVRSGGIDFTRMKNTWFYNETGTRFLGDTPEFLRGLRFATDVYQTYGISPAPSLGVNPNINSAVPAAMAYNWTNWTVYASSSRAPDRNFGLQFAPWDPETGTRGAIFPNAAFVSINSEASAEEQAAAWEFIKFLVSEEGHKVGYNAAGGYIQIPSPFLSLNNDYFLKPQDRNLAQMNLSIFLENVKYFDPQRSHRNDFNAAVNGTQVDAVLYEELNKVFDGEMAPEVWAAKVTPVINQILSEGLERLP